MLAWMQAISANLSQPWAVYSEADKKLGSFVAAICKVEDVQLFLRLTPRLSERFLSVKPFLWTSANFS